MAPIFFFFFCFEFFVSGLLAWLCAGKRAFLSVRSFDDPYPKGMLRHGLAARRDQGVPRMFKGFCSVEDATNLTHPRSV